MNKRRVSIILCLAMILMLLPVGLLSFDVSAIERPGEGYIAITNPTKWTPLSDYNGTSYGGDTEDLYVLYNGDYYPVQFETGQLYEDAGAGWQAHEVADYGQSLYHKSGSTYTAATTSRETWYQNLGNNVRIYGNFTKGANTAFWTIQLTSARESEGGIDSSEDPIYVYTRKSTGEPFWHVVYCHNHGVLGGYYCTLYYYTQSETATLTANQIRTTNLIGVTDGYQSTTWKNAINNGTIVKIGNDGQYAWAWRGEELTIVGDTAYTGGEMYIPKGQSPYANKLSVGSSVLAWPAPGSQYSDEYSGHLYKRLNNQKKKMYIDVPGEGKVYLLTDGVAREAVETTDLLYNGTLYYHSNNVPLPSPTPTSIITTDETGEDGVYTHKNLTQKGDTFDVELTAYTTGNEVTESETTITPTVDPMDIVMVIDQSGSMATRDMGNDYVPDSRTAWTVEQATSGQTRYVKVGSNYYPVQASTGYLYEEMETAPRGSDMIGWGDDGITLGVNGAPTFYNIKTDYYVMYNGEPHRLYLITAGLFLNYGLYPYIYVDNNDGYAKANKWEGHNYWVAVFDPWDGSDLRDNSTWNTLARNNRIAFIKADDGSVLTSSDSDADRARLSYSWITSSARINGLYKLSNSKAANQLYYVDGAGVRHNLGSQATFTDSVVYQNEQGPLYVGNSTSRLDALKDAVTEFTTTVQQNAEDFGVDHRMALVGFAGNKVPAYSLGSDAITVGSNGLKDYTNTGLFNSGDLAFENYERITGYTSTSDNYINRHYYRNNGNTLIKYIDGAWYTVDLNNGTKTKSYSGSWSKAAYEGNGTSLSAADYRSALLSVNQNDTVNGKITSAINSFGANGGTYTSYGMTMAEQLFESIPDSDRQAQNSEGKTVDRRRVIIVFTDGEPGGNGYESSIAGEALASGNLAKTDQDALVYTVGLFKGSPSSQVADFMKKLSSEYSMNLTPVYGGQDNANYSLGQLNPNKTYYYQNAETGKYYALTTEYGNGDSLGWWIYNGSRNGNTSSYSLTNPKTSTGAGTTIFYNANGSQVQGDNVRPGTTYYTANGDKIVYEYRWFDSDRSVINPMRSAGDSGSVGELRYQFYDLSGETANDDGLSYYMTASNAAELNNVFAQIAGSIVETNTTVANNSKFTEDTLYVMDEISADFDLPSNLSSSNNHVKVYADTVDEWNADGSPKTYNISTTELRQGNETDIEAGTADVKVTWEGKKLKVEYFDFGRMYMQQSNPNAARIRVVIDGIKPNRAGDANVISDLNPYEDNESGNALGALKSNTAQSGLYYKEPESGAVTLVEAFKVPSAPVPGYTVTWVSEDGTSEQYDQDVDLFKGDVPTYDGEEPTKDSEETASSYTTYEFDGWSTSEGGAKTVSIERDPESGVVTNYGDFASIVDEDVTYYAHFAATTVNYVTATWHNGTEELYQQKKVPEGAAPEYAGTMPSKASDHNYTYFFAGWHVGTHYNSDDALSYNEIKDLTGDKLTAYLANHGVVTQLDPITSDTDYYAVFAPVMLTTRNYILDFSTKTKLQGDTVTGYDAIYTPGGEFSLEKEEEAESGDFFFTPGMNRNSQYGPSDYYNFTGFSEVNTGVYYENTEKTKVNVIPASSVYFDDDLVNVEAEAKDGSGKNDAVPAYTSVNSIDTTDTVIMNYTFTGTGIDVYCTTDSETGYVMATLYKLNKDGSRGERVGKAKLMNNKSTTERLNVPTISFTGNESGTYQLELQALKKSHYKLDGIRIYNPVKDQSVYVNDDGTDSTEKNAIYQNLRTALITGTSGQVTVSDPESAIISNEKVLFVDDITRLDTGATRVVTDEDGKVVYNEDGTPKTEKVYETQFAAYKANSPKNEIYLEKNQAITFQLTKAARVGNHWVGLSAPEKGKNSGTVTVNGGTPFAVNSAVDMYYPISVGDDGSVTITNSGENMISITNLKITGVDLSAVPVNNAESMEPQMLMMSRTFAPLTMRSVMLAANNGVDPDADDPEPTIEPDDPDDPEPTIEPGDPDDPGPTIEPGDPDDPGPTIEPDDPDDPEPTIEPTPTPTPGQPRQSTIGKLITSIVNSIVKSIKRLFGR